MVQCTVQEAEPGT